MLNESRLSVERDGWKAVLVFTLLIGLFKQRYFTGLKRPWTLPLMLELLKYLVNRRGSKANEALELLRLWSRTTLTMQIYNTGGLFKRLTSSATLRPWRRVANRRLEIWTSGSMHVDS